MYIHILTGAWVYARVAIGTYFVHNGRIRMADMKLDHAREFTDIENLTLDLWLQLENANLDDNARRVLDAGLMFEHYTSLLDNDPGKRSLAEINQQAQLGFKLGDEVRLAQAALAAQSTRPTPKSLEKWVGEHKVS